MELAYTHINRMVDTDKSLKLNEELILLTYLSFKKRLDGIASYHEFLKEFQNIIIELQSSDYDLIAYCEGDDLNKIIVFPETQIGEFINFQEDEVKNISFSFSHGREIFVTSEVTIREIKKSLDLCYGLFSTQDYYEKYKRQILIINSDFDDDDEEIELMIPPDTTAGEIKKALRVCYNLIGNLEHGLILEQTPGSLA